MNKTYTLFIVFLLFIVKLHAAPFVGQIHHFKQPDGKIVDVKLFGNEYYMRAESLDGFTLIRDKSNGYICYATLSHNEQELISSGIYYTGVQNNPSTLKSNLSFKLHLDISAEARKQKIKENRKKIEGDAESNNHSIDRMGTTITPVSGNIKGLTIVVDFADEVGNLPMSEFDAFCNDLNYSNFGNNGSLRKYYLDVSGGLVDYENIVFGYFRAPLTFAQYDSMDYADGAQQILDLALHWIQSLGFDFSTLSVNSDGSIRAINLMYTGNPPNWAQGMWFHKGYYGDFSANGVTTGDYNTSPANDPLTLATVAHENGHMIGKWPDTYKYENNTGLDGIGAFDLMCWYGSDTNPVTPNPLFRSNAGWGRVVDVTNYNGLNIDTALSRTCFKYVNLNDTNEFFLLENKFKMFRDLSIPHQGLSVWHIDRNGDNQTKHHEVFLEHANNNYVTEAGACFRTGAFSKFNASTLCNSNFYNGDPSGLKVWDISAADTIMDYMLGTSNASQILNILYLNFTNDNNLNGFIEPAESALLNISVQNNGQLNSDPATVSCTAVGLNAQYVTVNTAPIGVGIIDFGQSVPVSFNISIAANVQAGTQIALRFNVTDGVDSIYVTKLYTVGTQILMDNQAEYTCAAIFFDSGGEDNNYENNQDYIKTFYPANPGDFVHATFVQFDLEDDSNCSDDYLYVYNGSSTNSPFIDGYCGQTGPWELISTDPSGALTFEFHSDNSYRKAGWKAIITCAPYTSVINNTIANISISPNPSNGIIDINFNKVSDAVVEIMNATGSLVYTEQVKNKSLETFNLQFLSKGIYFIKINESNRVFTKKIVIQN